ncbi:UNVERIFIED_CONTAM: hypothetical protein Sradi_6928500 [Sesamum radiatum]|uniref:DUF4283 domain-containing protein n=1 Tax=Sesamum radiatum TaxID=300843 RepID=A0AAW2JH78_SESRA
MEDVIEGGPWLFQGQPIVLQCWEQGMSLRRQQHTHVPVWIRLKHLPMEYWTEEGLSTVASGIGTPLYSDGITKDCSRLDYARDPKRVDVEYEWLPQKCTNCCSLGHMENGCPANSMRKATAPPIKVFVKKRSVFPATVHAEQNTELAGVATSVSNNSRPSGLDKGKAIALYNSYDALDTVSMEESDDQLPGPNQRSPQVNVQRVRRNLLLNWSWFDDYAGPEGRIWLAWKPIRGDFNAVLDDSEVHGRAADTSASMTEFRNCIRDSGLVPLPFTGCPFTWHNCSDGPRSLWKRLDRMLANTSWMDAWPSSSYISALPSTSDHSPLILAGMNRGEEHVVFRFDNYLAHLPGFLTSVEDIWKHRIAGTAMYDTVCKLKLLKPVFRQQKRLKGNLTENVKQAKHFLDKAQGLFTTYKEDIFLDLVKSCRRVYSVAVKLEISMLQQRAKLRWLKHGDQSSKIFFRKINTTRVKQRIFQITKVDGELLTAQHDVNQEFISYFQNLLGGPSLQRRIDLEFLRHELKHTITPPKPAC